MKIARASCLCYETVNKHFFHIKELYDIKFVLGYENKYH